jgi:signal transduction histidine kinase
VTGRILTGLLVLIVALVVGAMVPLAINATSHDRSSFIQDTEGTARTYAALEQARVAGQANPALVSALGQVKVLGDRLQVVQTKYGKGTNLDIGMPSGNWKPLIAQAEQLSLESGPEAAAAQANLPTETTSSWVVTAIAVRGNGGEGPVAGVVLLARSAALLNSQIRTLWLILGAVGVAAILGATLMAVWLARWVSKPLAGLDSAASRLADGDLTIRAETGYGPPELRRLARTFNTMAGRLEALVHGSRAVLADVSHQLRTPLAALRLRLDFLAADAVEADPEMAAELAGAQDELSRLSRLVDGLLAVARAENVTPQPRVIDVAEVAAERVAAWLPVAEDRGIYLLIGTDHGGQAPNSPVLGWLGEGALEQVFDNLIANALDVLSAEGQIVVTTSQTQNGVRVTVSDNGPGMKAEDRERAFLRFTSNSPGGTGLGLAIVHRLVTSNGGTARLEDTPGGGLTAVLDVPGAGAGTGSGGEETSPAVGNAKTTR